MERSMVPFKNLPTKIRAVFVMWFSLAVWARVSTVQWNTFSSGQVAL